MSFWTSSPPILPDCTPPPAVAGESLGLVEIFGQGIMGNCKIIQWTVGNLPQWSRISNICLIMIGWLVYTQLTQLSVLNIPRSFLRHPLHLRGLIPNVESSEHFHNVFAVVDPSYETPLYIKCSLHLHPDFSKQMWTGFQAIYLNNSRISSLFVELHGWKEVLYIHMMA